MQEIMAYNIPREGPGDVLASGARGTETFKRGSQPAWFFISRQLGETSE